MRKKDCFLDVEFYYNGVFYRKSTSACGTKNILEIKDSAARIAQQAVIHREINIYNTSYFITTY